MGLEPQRRLASPAFGRAGKVLRGGSRRPKAPPSHSAAMTTDEFRAGRGPASPQSLFRAGQVRPGMQFMLPMAMLARSMPS